MSKMKDKLGQKKDSSNSKWLEFFELTSLHGYGYLFRYVQRSSFAITIHLYPGILEKINHQVTRWDGSV